jgi:hypothetical protein
VLDGGAEVRRGVDAPLELGAGLDDVEVGDLGDEIVVGSAQKSPS